MAKAAKKATDNVVNCIVDGGDWIEAWVVSCRGSLLSSYAINASSNLPTMNDMRGTRLCVKWSRSLIVEYQYAQKSKRAKVDSAKFISRKEWLEFEMRKSLCK